MYPKDNAFMYPNDNLLFTSEEIKKYEELFKRCEEEGSKNGICVTEELGMRSKLHMRFMEYTRYREIEITSVRDKRLRKLGQLVDINSEFFF